MKADILVVVGLQLEIGWLPPLITQSRNAKIQPAGSPRTVPVSRPSLVRRTCTVISWIPSRLSPMLTMLT